MAASGAVLARTGAAFEAPVRNASALSSSSSFGTSVVQLAPVRPAANQSKRLILTRAGLSEEQKTAGKKVLASFVAAGAALSIAGQALAGNPIDFAKSKAGEVVSGAQDVKSKLPGLPKVELPTGGSEGPATESGTRIDGIFGKNKPYPPPYPESIASNNGATGDEVVSKGKDVGTNMKDKAKGLVSSAKDASPNIPVPKAPELPSLPNPLDNLKEGAQNLQGDVKNTVASNLPTDSDKPDLPNPWRTLTKDMKGTTQDGKGKAAMAKGNMASKANGLKENISKKPV